MSRKFELYKIVKIVLKTLRRTNIPLYWSKYSRKDFAIHQHIMLIVLAEYARNTNRMLQMIKDMDRIRKVMKLKKIPHKSTISRELKGYQSTGSA